jgi:CRP-like cAMP-binding protein
MARRHDRKNRRRQNATEPLAARSVSRPACFRLEILARMKRPAPRRSRDPKVERLSEVQLFSACSKRELARIAALTTEIEVPLGRVLMRQGDPGRECFVIEEGRARVTIRGRKTTMMGPGESFGEMALLHTAPRSATVTAASDMHLLVLNSREFATLLNDVPSVARKVLAAVGERLRNAERAQPHH